MPKIALNKLLIILLLIPIISFGEEKYACEQTQLNIKTKVIESIITINFEDGGSDDVKTIYKITSNDKRRINAYSDEGSLIQVITFTKNPLKATFAQVGHIPINPDGGHVFSFTSNCIKIK